jgi:hypothetical protein
MPGQREGVQSGERAAGPQCIVAGDGDLRIAHPVADQQDDIARLSVGDGVAQRIRLVAGQAPGAAGRDIAGGATGDGVTDRIFRLVAAALAYVLTVI